MNKDIFLSNSLGNKKEKFVPINKNKIGMYVCGPTVYDDSHIGNARPLVVFDILYKVLKCKYGSKSVSYVRNITDIDDKIIQSSLEKKISIQDLTKKITANYHIDCDYLKCEKPNKEPKATENISLMVKMTEDLIKKNYAYINNKHVYFEVKKFKDYGKLSNKNLEELIAGSRVEISENKKNPEDFVLWKPSKEKEPSWDSPWGKGRPGWHLECSVMAKKYLGTKFDIHGGGRDLIFPHHENEIAQSRCANDSDAFANYWVHNGFITISNEKMAKSQGNILLIKEVKEWGAGQVLRLALMSSHYRQPLDWNEKLFQDCKNTIEKWYQVDATEVMFGYPDGKRLLEKTVKIPDEYLAPLYDDLNTPGYITNLHKLFDKAINGSENDKKIFISACNFVGLLVESKADWNFARLTAASIEAKVINEKVELLNKARENKDYVEADKIRKELVDNGIAIENKDGKTVWKLK